MQDNTSRTVFNAVTVGRVGRELSGLLIVLPSSAASRPFGLRPSAGFAGACGLRPPAALTQPVGGRRRACPSAPRRFGRKEERHAAHVADILDWVEAITPLIRQISRHDPNLASQLERASTSVALNVGEGMYGRGRRRVAVNATRQGDRAVGAGSHVHEASVPRHRRNADEPLAVLLRPVRLSSPSSAKQSSRAERSSGLGYAVQYERKARNDFCRGVRGATQSSATRPLPSSRTTGPPRPRVQS